MYSIGFACRLGILFLLPYLSSCPNSKQCARDADCRVDLRCDASIGECVECLEHSQCDAEEFCSRGRCRALTQVHQYCGSSTKLNETTGYDCAKQYPSLGFAVGGPKCLAHGGVPKKDNVQSARCGCADDADCGENRDHGLKHLCIDHTCVRQDSAHCGSSRAPCSPDQGGTSCLPDRSGSKYGVCGCDARVVETCQTLVAGHIIADQCFEERCICGNGSKCLVGSDRPDCCGGNCTSLLTDAGNCGTCAKTCPGKCLNGQCECAKSEDCKSSATDVCASVHIAAKGTRAEIQGRVCACSQFWDDTRTNLESCPRGYFCCSDVSRGTVGCCAKQCTEAVSSDCFTKQ